MVFYCVKIGYTCRYCDSFSEYCEQFRLYRLQVVQANGSRQGTPLYNRPCIIGACASPYKTDCTRKDIRKCQIDKYMEVIPWRMALLRSRANSKAKMVICLNNTTNGVLCVLNSSRNRLLITFARLPASIQ